jgi:uncharacterized phage protein gp47/JayE
VPYQRPTQNTIITNLQQAVTSYLGSANPLLRFSDLNVLIRVFANLLYVQYQYLDYISLNAIPSTAVDESLFTWAALKSLTLTPATPAQGTVQFSGTPGSLVSDGTVVVNAQLGVLYAVPDGYGGSIGDGGTFQTTVIATTAGSISNVEMPATLALQNPATGIQPAVTLVTDISGGTDVETEDSLRARMIQAFSNPSQGGALQDYVTWSLAFAPVTRCWVGGPSVMGAGTVSVWFMEDIVESEFNGIPQGRNGGSQYDSRLVTATGDQLALANYLFPLRPATAIVWCLAPSPVDLNITLAEVPSDSTIRANISAAVSSFLVRTATPGGSINADLSAGGTMRVSQLWTAIADVPGLDYFEITLINGSAPADITVSTGELLIPGTITYS